MRYCIESADLDKLALCAVALSKPACIVGPEGTGKTTLLEDIHERIQQLGQATKWIRLNNDSDRADRAEAVRQLLFATDDTLCLLDGGETLSPFDWWRIRRAGHRGLRLIATLHRNRALDVLHETSINWTVTKQLVATIYEGAEIEAVAENAFKENSGNVREVFRACYWFCARREA